MDVRLVVASGNREGQMIHVSTDKFIIGRAKDCHLRPTSELVSRYHCAILVGDDVIARDLGSRNGVQLNGERIVTEQKIKNGDKLVVGPLEFYVGINDDSTTAPPMNAENVSWLMQPNGSAVPGSDSLKPTVVLNCEPDRET